MKKLFILLIISLLLSSNIEAHPGIGIVKNSKGEIFYSDLSQVWKVSNGGKTKTVIVPNVHTHELHLDSKDNLYGEHLWYEGESTNKWGHFAWKYSADGKFSKEIPNTEGFLSNYSFTRDVDENMYWIERGKIESLLMKKTKTGEVSILQNFKTIDVRWQFCQKDGTFYYVDDNDLYKIKDKKIGLVAKDLDDVEGNNPLRKPNHSIYGICDDKAGNIYVTVYEKREVRKISPTGKMSIIYKSPLTWHPTGGVFDENANLWVLENNALNQVRVIRVAKVDLAETVANKSNDNSLIFNILHFFLGICLITLLIKKYRFTKVLNPIISTLFFIFLTY
ncbi:hypothetical protein [Emticicia sp. SJ17W-69]|uniref:hypothetical protein n=1 Tax=Emticicia sp. SJ17W-69 TaxID=3421657 RepID=UPI003EBC314C